MRVDTFGVDSHLGLRDIRSGKVGGQMWKDGTNILNVEFIIDNAGVLRLFLFVMGVIVRSR